MEERFEEAVQAVVSGGAESLRRLLAEDPDLVHTRSASMHQATLIHYLGANGVERENQKTQGNAVEICQILLDTRAEARASSKVYGGDSRTRDTVLSSNHPQDAGVQTNLVRTLIAGGADPNSLNDPSISWQAPFPVWT